MHDWEVLIKHVGRTASGVADSLVVVLRGHELNKIYHVSELHELHNLLIDDLHRATSIAFLSPLSSTSRDLLIPTSLRLLHGDEPNYAQGQKQNQGGAADAPLLNSFASKVTLQEDSDIALAPLDILDAFDLDIFRIVGDLQYYFWMEASLGRNRDNPDAKAPVYEGTEIIQMPKLQLRKEPR
ncbi:hypothetical protein V6N12_030052 [Hibiscus sabdariffa]|uniref:Uncharacterized protein n=1 Tax=Hibiscus sabdariffa TaxID=183260 RepID=A0ABR2CJ54_9ROSI